MRNFGDPKPMQIVCLDLEGVLIPEIWVGVARQTGIDELGLTTRDIPDYDELMQRRLALLERHELGIDDIQAVIGELEPLPGAVLFLDQLRERYQVIILSDTFYEFARPLLPQLHWPTLFCHRLEVSETGRITGYRLRQRDPKRQAVKALQSLNFSVAAAGDSYNDVSMLAQAEAGVLFRPPARVCEEFPHFPVARTYPELLMELETALRHG